MNLICWLLGGWHSIGRDIGISGHDYAVVVHFDRPYEYGKLTCKRCGHESQAVLYPREYRS